MEKKVCLLLSSMIVLLMMVSILFLLQFRYTIAGTMISNRQLENLKSELEADKESEISIFL